VRPLASEHSQSHNEASSPRSARSTAFRTRLSFRACSCNSRRRTLASSGVQKWQWVHASPFQHRSFLKAKATQGWHCFVKWSCSVASNRLHGSPSPGGGRTACSGLQDSWAHVNGGTSSGRFSKKDSKVATSRMLAFAPKVGDLTGGGVEQSEVGATDMAPGLAKCSWRMLKGRCKEC